MKRASLFLLAVVVALTFAAPRAFAQGSIVGDWDVTLQTPMGDNTFQVAFKQDGEKVSGLLKSPMGELPFDGGTLTGSDLKFAFTINVQGNSIVITMTGKLDGATLAGKADFGGFGEGDWTAKRATATAAAASPASTPAAPASTAAASTTSATGAGGTWDVVIRTPGGEVPATATLTDAAGKISGTFGSQMGEVPISGTMEGKSLKMTMVAQTPQGELTVILTGDLDGDAIVNGKADVAGMGQMEWSAKRTKQ
jgi:hypothetical protein